MPKKANGPKNPPDLVQIVYVSCAAPNLTEADIDDIVARSSANNAAAGLTGLLLHQGASFYGVLEGPQRRVFNRMEVVIADRRHSGLRILREEAIGSRRFANWSFGLLPRPGQREGNATRPEEFIRSFARRLK